MMERDSSTCLQIDYLGSEWTPDKKIQYASFSCHASYKGFSGVTHFEATENHISTFIEQLVIFFKEMKGEPELVCGWGDDILFLLRFFPIDMTGRILMECILKQSYYGNFYNSVHLHQKVEIQQIDYLARFLNAAVSNRCPNSINIISQL